jgi:hypothetical protein
MQCFQESVAVPVLVVVTVTVSVAISSSSPNPVAETVPRSPHNSLPNVRRSSVMVSRVICVYLRF